MKFPYRIACRIMLAAGVIASALLPAHVSAQATWPSRTIRMVVPFAPPSSTDDIARMLATKLSVRLGQTVVVDNKGGAGGSIGTDIVAKSAPDGYTMLFISTSVVTASASGKKLPYDPVKDLEPIGELAGAPFAVVVSNDLKATTLSEFISLARAQPTGISYATGGVGSITHLGTELLASVARLQLVHVPYKSLTLAFPDILTGRIQMALPVLSAATPQIRAGKLRGLAVTSLQRSPNLPDLPTAAEAGLPGFELVAWWGTLGPARMPAPIVKRLNEEQNAIFAMADVRERLLREGATSRSGTPEDFGKLIRFELARYSKLIKDANIQME